MEQITSLNDNAILLFQQGKHEQAVELLMKLLTHLRTVLSTAPKQEQQITFMCAAESLSTLPPRGNFIYNNVFKVVSSPAPHEERVSANRMTKMIISEGGACHVFTACVIYNLAIIHQHLGITGKHNDYLDKAEKLYRMCLKIAEGCVITTDDNSGSAAALNTTLCLLQAVCYNNLSQLYLDRNGCDDAEIESCLRNLCNIIVSLENEGGNDKSGAAVLFSEDEYDGLIANVLLLQPATVAAAA